MSSSNMHPSYTDSRIITKHRTILTLFLYRVNYMSVVYFKALHIFWKWMHYVKRRADLQTVALTGFLNTRVMTCDLTLCSSKLQNTILFEILVRPLRFSCDINIHHFDNIKELLSRIMLTL